MINSQTGTSRFEMAQLPQEVAKVVDKMNVGDISEPFIMIDPKTNREIVAIVKLKNRIEGHKANLRDDYEVLKQMYEAYAKNEIVSEWIKKKINSTYVYIEEGWRNCKFEHEGWLKR